MYKPKPSSQTGSGTETPTTMKPEDVQMIRNFLNFYYANDEPNSFEALVQGNNIQTSHSIFLSRLQWTCKKLDRTLTIADVNSVWAHIVDESANSALNLLNKQGWNSYDLALKTRAVLEGKRDLLEKRLEESAGAKTKGNRGVRDEADDGEGGKRRKVADGKFVGSFASMTLDSDMADDEVLGGYADVMGDVSMGNSAFGMDLVPQSDIHNRDIRPMRRNRITPKQLAEELGDMALDG